MAPRRGRTPPRGREAVMAAVQRAAVELLAEQGPRDVTVRAVAARAGVNHALVHRHFGTKDGLIRAVVTEQSRELGEAAAAMPCADAAAMLRLLTEHPAYWRVLARIVLDAPDMIADLDLPAAGITLGLIAGRSDVDDATRIAAAVAGSTALGWLVFGPHLARVLGLSDFASYEAKVGETVRAVVTPRRGGRAGPGG